MRPSRKKIARVIAEQLRSGQSINRLSKEVAAYLLAARRSSELESIMRDVMALRAEDGLVESSLTVAHHLTPAVNKEIKALIKTIRPGAKSIVIDENTDPELIGGFKLHVINQSLDLSIKAKINQLKQLTSERGI